MKIAISCFRYNPQQQYSAGYPDHVHTWHEQILFTAGMDVLLHEGRLSPGDYVMTEATDLGTVCLCGFHVTEENGKLSHEAAWLSSAPKSAPIPRMTTWPPK